MWRTVEFVQAVTHARQDTLAGRVGLFVGGTRPEGAGRCAALACKAAGASVLVTYASRDGPRSVADLVGACGSHGALPCDPTYPGALEAVFDAVDEIAGELDFVVHVVDIEGLDALERPLAQCLLGDFQEALDALVHGFLRTAQLALPRMRRGGTLVVMVDGRAPLTQPGHGVLRVALAALEAVVATLDAELAERHVRAHAILPHVREGAPPARPRGGAFDDAGPLAALLVSPAGSSLPRIFHVAAGRAGSGRIGTPAAP